MKQTLGIVYPPRCPFCDDLLEQEESVWFHPVYSGKKEDKQELQGWGIHDSCRKKLMVIRGAVCLHCGRPLEDERTEYCPDCSGRSKWNMTFRQGKSLYRYQGNAKKMMYRFKYANRREYGAFFAAEAATVFAGWLKRCRPQAILAVPMYRKKERQRGYNQASVFAKELSLAAKLPWIRDGLIRVRNTRPMKELNDAERKRNIAGAFAASEKIAGYERLLVVDDIYTTGSTADEAAATLQRAGVREVYFLFICIGSGN